LGACYVLPTMPCMQLQNILVKALVDSLVWDRLDYLYIHAHVGATLFTGINWIQPSNPLSTFTGITHVPKKGIYGTQITGGWNIGTHRVKMTAPSNASFFTMLGTTSGAIAVAEHLLSIIGANSYVQTIRLRTNPRVDYLFNGTTATASVLHEGLPVAQRLYTLDKYNSGGDIHSTEWFNGTLQADVIGGSGILPDTGTVNSLAVATTRTLALVGGGSALTPTAKVPPLNTALQNYMNALNLL